MASSGPAYPTTKTTQAVAPENSDNWVSITNIGADDATYASITAATYDSPDICYRAKAQGFGFAIPAGSTIDGIVVEIERRCAAGGAQDYRVQLLDDTGALVGANKASATAWPGSDTMASYGGAADTWTATPTVAMVNDPDFGVVLSVSATVANTDIYVDYIRMTVYYTPPPTDYPLTANTGSYAVGGVDADLKAARVLADGGAGPGSYGVTGLSTTLLHGYPLDATAGSYAVTGAPATETAARLLTPDAGSYAVNGLAATVAPQRILTADPGSYVVAGADGTLVYVPAIGAYELSADPGSYAVTGLPLTVLATRLLTADPGAYTVLGGDAGLAHGYALDLAPGSYLVAGADGTLLHGYEVQAAPGVYVLVGTGLDIEAPVHFRSRPWYPLWDPWKHPERRRR